jgi:hypothetical protein
MIFVLDNYKANIVFGQGGKLEDPEKTLKVYIKENEPSGVEKVSEPPGNLVPRNFFELRVLQKIFQKILQHFEIALFTQLSSYNYSTLFTLYTLTSAAF